MRVLEPTLVPVAACARLGLFFFGAIGNVVVDQLTLEHVGGPAHAHVLLDLLETLAGVEEGIVRDKSVASIKLIAKVRSVRERVGRQRIHVLFSLGA